MTTPTPRMVPRSAGGVGKVVSPWRWDTIWILALMALLLLPIATVVVLSTGAGSDGVFHVSATILPRVAWSTILLLAGTGVLTLAVGTLTAWVVTLHTFPGRSLVDRALVLPLAIPAYLAAYVWVEVLEPTGPLHGVLAGIFGWRSVRDSWLPDLRSLTGAILIVSSVLYPYVYLAARTSFIQQSAAVLEVARTLGCGPVVAMARVGLPLARPALAAGVSLVAMEALGDFGAMQYLGVETLTVAIYATWLQRNSLGGAAQLAVCALGLVVVLVAIERAQRQRQSFHDTTGRARILPTTPLHGAWAVGAILACSLPVAIGFCVPAFVLIGHALNYLHVVRTAAFWFAFWHSLILAALASAATVAIAVVLAYARRFQPSRLVAAATTLISVGYALPGTVLALGLLLPLAGFDNAVDGFARATLGISTGLVLSGGLGIVILAYVIRTLAAALGAIDAGWSRLSPNLDAAARTLGDSASMAVRRVHLPLLRPALGAAAIVVFVDCLKELPATLLLRPFNFDTLATQVYAAAALEQFESSAIGALAIVAAGLVPVLLLHRTMAERRRR